MLMAAAAGVGLLFYTYLGYPLLIALLARLFPMRVERDPSYQPTVSVCMTVFNGAAYLDRKIESLLAMDWPRHKLEILIYSDASTDGTDAIIARWAAREPVVRFIRGTTREGKPTGLNCLREIAVGEVLMLTDVRQPVSRAPCARWPNGLADRTVGCVSGNLVLEGEAGSGMYWRYEKFIRRQEARFRSLVGVSGSIALVRKVDMPVLPHDLVLDDVWIPMRLRLEGRRIIMADEAEAYDVAAEDDREFGRKVRTLAGNYQLFAWMPLLLSPLHNRSWFETFSHKFLRLLCPWVLLLLVGVAWAAAMGETHPTARAAGEALLGAQVIFYFIALVGPRAGRLGRLARTFVVMNMAALLGFGRFLSGRQR